MTFFFWLLTTPYLYAPPVLAVVVFGLGHPWPNALGALLLGAAIFLPAGWFQFRRGKQDGAAFSAVRSRAKSVDRWPTEDVARHETFVVGVLPGTSGNRRAHVLIFVPQADQVWRFVREPAISGRGGIRPMAFPSYGSMVAELEARGIRYLPPTPYSRALGRQLRDRLVLRGISGQSLAAGTHEVEYVSTLVVRGGLSASGPRFAEFDGRVPTRQEAARITDEGLGLALHRVPKADRDLDFLSWMPTLRALWIHGRVFPGRIGTLTELRQLSLLTAGDGEVDLSALDQLVLYEGQLRGRESVLSLPLRELYLDRVSDGYLERVPDTLHTLSLERATTLTNLNLIATATSLRELSVSGSTTLELSAIDSLKSLRTLALSNIGHLSNARALLHAANLRELTLLNVRSIDDPDAIEQLQLQSVTVSSA